MSCCAPDPEAGHKASGARAATAAQPQTGGSVPDHDVVHLPGGTFLMGSEDPDVNRADGEGPVRPEHVDAFAISRHTVTNAQFRDFVAATGYVTEAVGYGWSFVFHLFLTPDVVARSPRPQGTPWWHAVKGALWDTPTGPGSSIDDILDHPVVHVSWRDADAYAGWAGGRLPTEKEWEYAARGGLEGARYAWGDELTPGGEHRCNIWQGSFPVANSAEDGHVGTAPVTSFEPNGHGLYNVAGNVWEMCSDVWDPRPATPGSVPLDPGRRVMRGGSYLCHDSYCNRYRVAARTSNSADSSSGNVGFRIAFDVA